MLFAWLLWGDFCFTMMEAVVPSILPLKLKDLGAPNWLMGAIMTTGPGILNMTVCPWVSFKSDRFRSRWGRRIPFIILTMPFLCLFLGALGWSEEIAACLQHWSPAMREYAPTTITIVFISIFMMMFQFFNMFVGSVFWYLFNDVVPAQFLGRFMGSFKFVNIGAAAIYNWFIFGYAKTNMREIFTGAALLYLVGFGLMCLLLKEGKYPEVEGETDKQNKGWGGLLTFFKESFSHKFYWYRFLFTSASAAAGSIALFGMFYSIEMGLSLEQIGKSTAITSVVTMFAIIFMATFVDRWHPLRLTTYSAVFSVMSTGWVWLFVTLPDNYFFWIGIFGGVVGAFHSALVQTAGLPCEMRIFPQSRFGQFCSAQAMVRSLCTCISGVLAGVFIDVIKWFCNGSDFAYRFSFLWSWFFTIVSAVFLVLVYIEWNKMGGDKHFHPPAPWSPEGREEMPITPTVSPQTRWLKLALFCFEGIMAGSVLLIPAMLWWMYMKNQMFAFTAYLVVILPLSLAAWFLWRRVKSSILRDMDAARNGRPLRNGLPHHGMLVLVGSKMFILLGSWIFEVIVSTHLNLQGGAVAFGAGRVATNFMVIGCIWAICRIERGYSVTIDEKPIEAS